MDTIKISDKKQAKMVAHMGLSGIERENSILAFVAAGNRDYFGIECDIHVTSDGNYVVYHDDRTNRFCNGDYPVEESSLECLRALKLKESQSDLFSDTLKIPTLSEYIAVCKRYDKVAVVELKNPVVEEHIVKIVNLCHFEYNPEKIIFISFCFENLVCIRKHFPSQKVQFLCNKIDDELIERLKRHRFDLDVWYPALNEENARALKRAGIVVNSWTCDDLKDAERLISYGVDYITTNILQ